MTDDCYKQLNTYNTNVQGTVFVNDKKAFSTLQLVPMWQSLGYNALTHNAPNQSCNGHFNVDWAYGRNGSVGAGSCGVILPRTCTGQFVKK